MENYNSHTDLLSSKFQTIASWWDSMLFIDKEDPSVVLKLYDPLNLEEVQKYYQIQKELSQKSGVIREGNLEVNIVDPTDSDKFLITTNEDGILVVLPKIEWVNLWTYGSDIQRAEIVNQVKEILSARWLPISWGFEVKPENIMVHEKVWGTDLSLYITDVGARVDECIREYTQL